MTPGRPAVARHRPRRTRRPATPGHFLRLAHLAERTLRAFGQTVSRGERWHQELLDAASWSIGGVRPAIFGPSTVADLRVLLRFRHFFRHAYAVAWDPEKLRANLTVLARVEPLLASDIAALLEVIEAV